ncbi:alpha/beta fold hydrolase [Rhodoplanes sp. Z2-YC6860]|uniref:alpha/beta fold hydrolase n=1 Tax=Rhodoplanes sp. Z2-YC6860 TaxID=674703 RepID=UPI00078E9BBB|nr:alpha/beta hydrolase [Rhodoplanes sp. Z2-YC6860]AMN42087.1 alpha/beta hydrolase family protein [Rhodoplanes sp. Z2-YC6860]
MSEAKVGNVVIFYEVIGNAGPWIALTPGSRRSYDELVPLSKMLAQHGYRVLLHDRRNCGRSEVGIEARGSEHEIWADDLYELAKQLNALPLYVGGSSAGARLALLFALRHPDAVKGMLLWRVTGGQHAAQKLAHQYYGSFAEMAKAGGMAAVCASDHFAACIKARPSNRERLMAMKPEDFIAIMDIWRKNFLAAADLPVVGATEAQLRALKIPACIIAGNDQVHTPQTARKAASLIGNSEFHDDVVVKRLDNDLLKEWDQQEWKSKEGRLAEIFSAFLKRVD